MKTHRQRYAREPVLRNLLIAGAMVGALSAWADCDRARAGEGAAIPDAPAPVVQLEYALPRLRIRPPGPVENNVPAPAAPDAPPAADGGVAGETPRAAPEALAITPLPRAATPALQDNGTIVVEEKSLAELLAGEKAGADKTDASPLTITPEPGSALAPDAAPPSSTEATPPPDTYHPPRKNDRIPERNGTPRDPFQDIPKYIDAWIPQDSLEFHNEILVKVQATPTYPNLEAQREILASTLLEKYNRLLASAGRVGSVEMVMSNPVRYAKDGSWLKGEFDQIVHDIWGRRLPEYETDYYVVVLEN